MAHDITPSVGHFCIVMQISREDAQLAISHQTSSQEVCMDDDILDSLHSNSKLPHAFVYPAIRVPFTSNPLHLNVIDHKRTRQRLPCSERKACRRNSHNVKVCIFNSSSGRATLTITTLQNYLTLVSKLFFVSLQMLRRGRMPAPSRRRPGSRLRYVRYVQRDLRRRFLTRRRHKQRKEEEQEQFDTIGGEECTSWVPQWLPRWLLRIPPIVQGFISLGVFLIHQFILTQKGWTVSLKKGSMRYGIGLDAVAVITVLALIIVWRVASQKVTLIPGMFRSSKAFDPPWILPKRARRKRKILPTIALLIGSYVISGYLAVFVEYGLYFLASIGVPITFHTLEAWKGLSAHLLWVVMGLSILRWKQKPFFPNKGHWINWSLRGNWVWWTCGGYLLSALLYNTSTLINHLILPVTVLKRTMPCPDPVVALSQMFLPGADYDPGGLTAVAINAIGPCISAPIFEEVLYRGYLLPALSMYLPLWASIPISSLVFALPHGSSAGLLPLSVLGMAWSLLYTQSRNLAVPIAIHAMWNTRAFLFVP